MLVLRLGGGKEGEGKGKGAPGLGDDDVVEGGVAFAEAGEADFEDHCWFRMGERYDWRFKLCGAFDIVTFYFHGDNPALRFGDICLAAPQPFTLLLLKRVPCPPWQDYSFYPKFPPGNRLRCGRNPR